MTSVPRTKRSRVQSVGSSLCGSDRFFEPVALRRALTDKGIAVQIQIHVMLNLLTPRSCVGFAQTCAANVGL